MMDVTDIFVIKKKNVVETHPIVARIYVLSRLNRLKDFQNSGSFLEGGRRGRIRKQARTRRPLMSAALALTELPKPLLVCSVLLSMMGWITEPNEEPDATTDMAIARCL
jgi:hypothetical protein